MNGKLISMKRAFVLFWRGLTGLLTGIAEWLTEILGMRDDSKYGRFLRRVVGTSFAASMLMFGIAMVYAIGRAFYEELPASARYGDVYYDVQYLSRHANYYSRSNQTDGYVKTSDGEKTIRDIRWIAKPLGDDSLICYSTGKKRGYFNCFTGRPVIRPCYSHAWIFSEGLAAVDDEGWIKFIDAQGKVVIDPKLPYQPYAEGYVFHNGYCIAPNRNNRLGMIDKRGKWVLEPVYTSIELVDSFWIVGDGQRKCVVGNGLKTVIPWLEGRIFVGSQYISVTRNDHVTQRYNLLGELTEDFYISDVELMTYETDELHQPVSRHYNEEGVLICEREDMEAQPEPQEKVAKCRRYEAETEWYGLITAEGQVITPPSYCSIKAIGYDLYLCKDNFEDGIILNGKGERIR
jgi:hypothetical protein